MSRSRLVVYGRVAAFTVLLGTLIAASEARAQAQLSYSRGQSVSPAFEGWVEESDGKRYFLFGYMNRNWQEELDIPVGEGNFFSPGAADQGQPTHFLPRRHRFTFMVPVPEGFGEEDELVWTLTAHGETDRAYASLRPDYLVDNVVIASETGSLGAGSSSPATRSNTPPVIELEGGPVRHARVGEPVTLVATVTDDGLPRTRGGSLVGESLENNPLAVAAAARAARDEERVFRQALSPPSRITVNKTNGLHFAWFVYRGGNVATFDPIQIKTWEDTRAGANSPWAPQWNPPPVPDDNRWIVRVTFDEPGVYVLQGRADDGGLYADTRVTIEVAP